MIAPQLTFENLEADLNDGKIFIAGKEVSFTKKEKDVLLYFLRHPNKLLPKEVFAKVILGSEASLLDDYTIVFRLISQVSRKLATSGCAEYIHEPQKEYYSLGKVHKDHKSQL